jgi:uncharacterized phage-associated protein
MQIGLVFVWFTSSINKSSTAIKKKTHSETPWVWGVSLVKNTERVLSRYVQKFFLKHMFAQHIQKKRR